MKQADIQELKRWIPLAPAGKPQKCGVMGLDGRVRELNFVSRGTKLKKKPERAK
jgi:hypothetical protein